ncbi:MAG TPA: biotin/lipoyl-containing protein, partial [Burkholderiales bacterium]
MAIIEVKVPQLSESVAEATLLDWHKKEGEKVSRDENLIDIETDKVVLELPAPADGVLVKIIKKSRDAVGSGEVIAQIDTEGKAGVASASPKKEVPQEKAKSAPAVMPAAQK